MPNPPSPEELSKTAMKSLEKESKSYIIDVEEQAVSNAWVEELLAGLDARERLVIQARVFGEYRQDEILIR